MAALSSENQFRNVFNPRIITSFASDIKKVWHDFNNKSFLNAILPKLDNLGFKERSDLIRDSLFKYLPKDFPSAIDILLQALEEEASADGDIVTNWDSFIVWPQTAFVSKYGQDHFELSLNALYEMTKRLTAEGDLRTFIEIDEKRTMQILHKWCEDKNHHIRRLVSEGTRPRLPLAGRIKRFQKNPKPVIELLEKLKKDQSLYVRRSVANSLNDIAKDNPDIAIATLKKWNKDLDPKVQWIVKHASRSLIKQGHMEIMQMFGCDVNPKIDISEIDLNPKKQKIGGDIKFSFEIKSNAKIDQKLIVDFAIYFKKANGKLSPKVFKLKNLTLPAKSKIAITKKFSLRNTAGRKIYSGIQMIKILVNGKSYSESNFEVM